MNMAAILFALTLSRQIIAPLTIQPTNDWCLWEPNKGIVAVVNGPAVIIASSEANIVVVFKCDKSLPYGYAEIAFKLEDAK